MICPWPQPTKNRPSRTPPMTLEHSSKGKCSSLGYISLSERRSWSGPMPASKLCTKLPCILKWSHTTTKLCNPSQWLLFKRTPSLALTFKMMKLRPSMLSGLATVRLSSLAPPTDELSEVFPPRTEPLAFLGAKTPMGPTNISLTLMSSANTAKNRGTFRTAFINKEKPKPPWRMLKESHTRSPESAPINLTFLTSIY